MIHDFSYYDGEPTYMSAIDSWTERVRPGWHGRVFGITAAREVQAWINENLTGDYETIMRFNSGNPYLSITIYEREDALALQLRWS